MAPRVVSLIASATEIVSALGFRGSLVGRSHECDFPPSVRRLPALTSPKFRTDGSSLNIDRRVKDLLRDALSVYRVSAGALERLRPDLIVTQTQCEACAVSERDVREAVSCRLGEKARIVSLRPNKLSDVWADIQRVAVALKVPERGRTVVAGLKKRMSDIAAESKRLPRPSVACVEWIEPLMAAGNWMPELVSMAGGRNLFGKAGRHSPWMTWRELKRKDPDVVVVLPCGFDIPRTRSEMRSLTRRKGWGRLKAVKAGRVFLADGNQYFNRPGPRLAESLEILAEVLHPEAFHFGREGRGWERL